MTEYEDRLKFLELESLSVRRERIDLCLAHRLYHVNRDSQFACLMPHQVQLRHLRPTNRILSESEPARRLFFPNRIASKWNALSVDLVQLSNNAFKQNIPK